MARYEIVLRLKGPAGESDIAPDPPSFEADTLNAALAFLADSQFPDNAMVKTIGVSLKRVSDLGVTATPAFSDSEEAEEGRAESK